MFIYRYFYRLFLNRFLKADDLWLILNKNRIDKCLRFVIIGDNTSFYEQAEVVNMQGNKNKIVIGSNTHIRGKIQLFEQGGEIKIGSYCYLGENSHIWSAGYIEIGDRVLISHNVNIHDNISHPIDEIERHKDYKRILGLEYHNAVDFDLKPSSIIIEEDAWIGFNSTILRGVRIGKGAIVASCSLVTKDVPDYAIVAGNPAKVIKYTK